MDSCKQCVHRGKVKACINEPCSVRESWAYKNLERINKNLSAKNTRLTKKLNKDDESDDDYMTEADYQTWGSV